MLHPETNPQGLSGQLHQYQKAALHWMKHIEKRGPLGS